MKRKINKIIIAAFLVAIHTDFPGYGQDNDEQNNPFESLESKIARSQLLKQVQPVIQKAPESPTSEKPAPPPEQLVSPPIEALVFDYDQENNLASLSANNVELRSVLHFIAEESGKNIILARDVKGLVSANLKNVTLEQAFQTIAKSGGCVIEVEGDSMFVSNADNIRDILVYRLDFANAVNLEEAVKQLVSSTGKVGVDARLNSLIISDVVSNLESIRKAIAKLDVMATQVLIEVMIVNTKLTKELKMGIDWSQLGTPEFYYNQSLSAVGGVNPGGEVNVALTSSDWNITGLLDFVETHDNVSVLANPKLLVLNNHTATIDSIEEIPYQEKTSTAEGGDFVSTDFKEAGIKLEVTPQVTKDNYIIINVMPEQSAQIGTFTVGGNETPVIETRKSKTSLQVADGQTIIIAGLRQKRPTKKVSKIPLIGDIPLLGLLFRKVIEEDQESELAVFITPHICKGDFLDNDTKKTLDRTRIIEDLEFDNITGKRRKTGKRQKITSIAQAKLMMDNYLEKQ